MSEIEALVEFLYLTPVGIIKFRPDGYIEMANPLAAQLLMPLATGGDMSNLFDVFSIMAPGLRGLVAAFLPAAGPICDQIHLHTPQSRQVLTLGIIKINGHTLMAVLQDITLAIAREARVHEDQERFRAIFENIRDYAICTVDLEGRVDEWNRSLNRFGGWNPADVAASGQAILLALAGGQQAADSLLARASQHGTAEYEGWGRRSDGNIFWGSTIATALPGPDGAANGFVLVTRDLTDRKHNENRLVELATIDPLTSALNRRAGDDRLEETFRRWQHNGRPYAALMLDCDNFKQINDSFGHEAGDKLLIAVVRTCRANMRGADATIRWGGEEFLVLLPETSGDVAVTVAERMRKAIGVTEIASGTEIISITVSVGVAESNTLDASAADVVRRADVALYNAKKSGRNCVFRQV